MRSPIQIIGLKIPIFQQRSQAVNQIAHGATKIQGYFASQGFNAKLVIPPPTWNKALPIHKKITAIRGRFKK